jgi:uncharacterized protein (TIGR03000 family)
MFRRMTTRMRILSLAGLGFFYVPAPAHAQQGWPIAGAYWDTYGGRDGPGGSSWSFSESYSPSYYSSSIYPSSSGSYSDSYSVSSLTGNSSYNYGTPSTAESSKKRSAAINLRVPNDAKVWFDQTQTKQTGTLRSFESPPLDAPWEYAYQIRIQWTRDGKDMTVTRPVALHAGDIINLTLGFPPEVTAPR